MTLYQFNLSADLDRFYAKKIAKLDKEKNSPVFFNKMLFISKKKNYVFFRKSDSVLEVIMIKKSNVQKKILKLGRFMLKKDEILGIVFAWNNEIGESAVVFTTMGLIITIVGLNGANLEEVKISDIDQTTLKLSSKGKVQCKQLEKEMLCSVSPYFPDFGSCFLSSKKVRVKQTGARDHIVSIYWVKLNKKTNIVDKKVLKHPIKSKKNLQFPQNYQTHRPLLTPIKTLYAYH